MGRHSVPLCSAADSLVASSPSSVLLPRRRAQGYDAYITVFYVLVALVAACLALTVWVAVVLKKDEGGGTWLKR